jgi:tripartite ATP-independent transporter DctP family solute receptor
MAIDRRLFTAGLLAAPFLGGKAATAQGRTTLRYAHVGTETEAQGRYANELAGLVRERTQGRIDIRVFPGGQLGNLSEMIDGVRIGSIAMAHHDFASLDRFDRDVAVFNAPYAFRDANHAMRATAEATSPVLRETNERLVAAGGVRIVGNFYRGARHFSSRFAIRSPADMAGKRFRGVPLPLWNTMLRGMGAIPTPVEIAEIMPALMTGLVEGQENPLNTIISRRMFEANKFVSMTAHMESVLAVFVNERVWQGLSAGDREVFQASFAEMARRSMTWQADAEGQEIAQLRQQGVTIIDASSGLDVQAFRTAVMRQVLADFPHWGPLLERLNQIQNS